MGAPDAMADTSYGASPRPRPRSYTGSAIAAMTFPDPDPVVHYAERGCIFDLVGPAKKGKTTFTLHGCQAVLAGKPYLGVKTKRVPILYLTEQTSRSFRDKLEAVGLLLGNDDFHVFFIADFIGLSWPKICEIVREEVRAYGVGLVYIDTLTDWAHMENENDAAEALRVMRPLRVIAEDGVALVTCRHSGKGSHDGQDVVDVGRGSSAFAGVVDTLCVMGGVQGQGHPRQRQLRFVSRKDGIPQRLVIELTDGRYVCLGDAPDVEYRLAREFVLDHLPRSEARALTEKEILEEGRGQFSRRTLQRVLGGDKGVGGLIREGLVTCCKGAGEASSKAFGYWLTGDDDEQLGLPDEF